MTATDISGLTNHGNADIINSSRPVCDVCACYHKYLANDSIRSIIDADLERTGFASFIVTMFVSDATTDVNVRARLCYGVTNRFLSVLIVKEVVGTRKKVDVGFTITSELGKSTTRSFNLSAG